jgi:DNA-binding winged helix-turn-helix (wHTH) protein
MSIPDGRGGTLMEGEDPETQDARDARHWISVYAQLIGFKHRLLDKAVSEIAALDPLLQQELSVDVALIQDQLGRYQRRIDFWYDRHFALEGIIMDGPTRTVSHRGKSVQLTGREFQLLNAFLDGPERYFTSRQLVLKAWNNPALSDEELRLYIGNLRRKLRLIGLARIVNRPSHGYSLVFNAAPAAVDGAAS